MIDERRYDEREIAEIMERAIANESKGASVPATKATGLTLTQLQEIGSEVGIAPERIVDAARAVRSQALVRPAKTFLGAPRSVARVVAIPRSLNDDEWMRLVADVRATFGAVGKLSQHGSLRSWSNGNLQVHVEPEGDHYRIRMQTLKGDVFPIAFMSGAGLFMAANFVLSSTLGSSSAGGLGIAALFGAVGLGALAYLRASLPRWAGERADQMEAIAARIPLLLNESTTPQRDGA